MTQDKAGSISSEETEASKRYSDVVNLGRRIVDELDLGDSRDTLARWLAHRIAEVIDAADRATDPDEQRALRADCERLILEVWGHRDHWPRGWPPEGAADVLAELVPQERQPYQRRGQPKTWLEALRPLEELQQKERHLVVQAALRGVDVSSEGAWLADHADALEPDEVEVLERMLRVADEAQHTSSSESLADRAIAIGDALEELAAERSKLFAQVLKAVHSQSDEPARRPPKRNRKSSPSRTTKRSRRDGAADGK